MRGRGYDLALSPTASLRYLLVAPVRRARLLTSKLVVGVGSTLLATVLLPAWGLLVGGVFYLAYLALVVGTISGVFGASETH